MTATHKGDKAIRAAATLRPGYHFLFSAERLKKAFTGFKFSRFLSCNFDFCTRTGIAANASRTFGDTESTKSYESYPSTFGKLLFHYVDIGIQSFACINFGHSCLFCHCSNQFGLVHDNFFLGFIFNFTFANIYLFFYVSNTLKKKFVLKKTPQN